MNFESIIGTVHNSFMILPGVTWVGLSQLNDHMQFPVKILSSKLTFIFQFCFLLLSYLSLVNLGLCFIRKLLVAFSMKTGLLWNFNAGRVDQCQNLQKSVAILAFLPSECFQIAALVKALAHVVALNSFKSSSEALSEWIKHFNSALVDEPAAVAAVASVAILVVNVFLVDRERARKCCLLIGRNRVNRKPASFIKAVVHE